jgi:hypothetical protein
MSLKASRCGRHTARQCVPLDCPRVSQVANRARGGRAQAAALAESVRCGECGSPITTITLLRSGHIRQIDFDFSQARGPSACAGPSRPAAAAAPAAPPGPSARSRAAPSGSPRREKKITAGRRACISAAPASARETAHASSSTTMAGSEFGHGDAITSSTRFSWIFVPPSFSCVKPFVPFVYRPRPYDPNIGGFGGQRATFNIYDETSINLTRGVVVLLAGLEEGRGLAGALAALVRPLAVADAGAHRERAGVLVLEVALHDGADDLVGVLAVLDRVVVDAGPREGGHQVHVEVPVVKSTRRATDRALDASSESPRTSSSSESPRTSSCCAPTTSTSSSTVVPAMSLRVKHTSCRIWGLLAKERPK